MNKVIIYTSEGCSHCHSAKEFLNENKIPYTEHNISKDIDAKKEFIKNKIMSVPYIIINGQGIIGFDVDKVKQLLNI